MILSHTVGSMGLVCDLHVVDFYAYIDPMGYVFIFTKIIGSFYWRLLTLYCTYC